MANVEFRYTPTEDDYVLGLSEQNQRLPFWLGSTLMATLSYFLFCLFAAVLVVAIPNTGVRAATFLGCIGILLLNTLNLLRSNRTAAQLREIVRKAPHLRLPVAGVANEGGISRITQVADSQFAWGTYAGCAEYDDGFVLIPIGSFLPSEVLPRRAFGSPEAIDAFRTLVTNAFSRPPTRSKRPAWPPLTWKLPNAFFTLLLAAGVFFCAVAGLIAVFSNTGARP